MLYVQFPEWLSPFVIPGLPLRWYGIMYLINFAVAYYLIKHQGKSLKPPLDQQTLFNLIFSIIIGLLVGARIFATTIYDSSGYYLSRPWLIFWPFDENMRFTGLQGMSYHGGLVGAFVGFCIFYRKIREKYRFFELADIISAAIPLGYTLGRIGNFINGELYGRITLSPFGMIFPHAQKVPISDPTVLEYASKLSIFPDENGMVNLPRHPSQLYEAFLEGILLWLVLWFIVRKYKPYHGFVFCAYLVGYGITRFIAEYFRQPDIGLDFVIPLSSAQNPGWMFLSPWNFTMGQILSSIMIVGGIALAVFLYKRQQAVPSVKTFEEEQQEKNKQRRQKKKFHLR